MHLCGACVIYMDKMFLVDSRLFGHRVAEHIRSLLWVKNLAMHVKQ